MDAYYSKEAQRKYGDVGIKPPNPVAIAKAYKQDASALAVVYD